MNKNEYFIDDFIRSNTYQCIMNTANSLNMISASLTQLIQPLNSTIQSIQELNRYACNLAESFSILSEMNQSIITSGNLIPIGIKHSVSYLSEITNSIRPVLNLPHIAEQFRNPEFEEFCSSYEKMMQSLDFPVVQPEITEDQLEKRLEQMENEDVIKTTSSTIDAVNHAPIPENIKKKLIQLVKSGMLIVVIPYLINVVSDLTSDTIKNKMNQTKNEQQISQYTYENISVTVNNYSIELSGVNIESNELPHECDCNCSNGADQNTTEESLPSIATSTIKFD